STLYDGFSPNYMIFVRDMSSDHFGLSYANSSYGWGSKPSVAAVEFKSDLSVADGTDGYDSRIFRMAGFDGFTGSTSGQFSPYLWVGSVDPDSDNIIYYAGQISPLVWYADIENPDVLQNADPSGVLAGTFPRSI